jgi:hypothetical protein
VGVGRKFILAVAVFFCAAGGASAKPALFRVGAAVRSIAPVVPVYAGGFSLSPPITREHDPLQVRAFYISNGHTALAFVVVDAQGYFSGYQEGQDLGQLADRIDAARAASVSGGVKMTDADIIEQATHSHAAATLEGIWGPVPIKYLQLVHDQVVSAVAAAAAAARPAYVQFGTIGDQNIVGSTINQDNYQGWVTDIQLSILRAVDPRTGATIATFASVPTHGAHVCGQCLKILSADYFGAVRMALDRQLGGINVVGPALLGRQESPVETTGIANMEWIAGVIDNDLLEALAHAYWITSPQLAAVQTTLQYPASNVALLALDSAWHLSDAQKAQEAQTTGIYPIDRADRPPFETGNVLTTWLTAFRIGDVAFLSMPGEPFPEVRLAIVQQTDARTVVALSKGQDDFGYFFPAFDYVFPEAYNSDHLIFNVAPQLGDQVIASQVQNMRALGFGTRSVLDTPLANNYFAKLQPGLQTMASPPTGDAGPNGRFTSTLQAIFMPASITDPQLAGQVHWDFGDFTHADTGYIQVGQDWGQTGQAVHGVARFEHSWAPGTYHVIATAHDTAGNPMSWTITVRVFPQLHVNCRGRVWGGEGTVLRRSWHRVGRFRVLSVLDAAGGTATARCR